MCMSELFGDSIDRPVDAKVVTALQPSPRNAALMVVRVGVQGARGKVVTTLSAAAAARLGLAVGTPWTTSLEVFVRDEAEYERAMGDGMKLVNRRAVSVADMRAKLTTRGHAETVVERVVSRMQALGVLDDSKLARELVDYTKEKKPAGEALLRDKLARRGIDEKAIEGAIESHRGGGDAVEEALSLARKKLAGSGGLDAATRYRRAASVLARRGFDDDTIRSVMEKLGLGAEFDQD